MAVAKAKDEGLLYDDEQDPSGLFGDPGLDDEDLSALDRGDSLEPIEEEEEKPEEQEAPAEEEEAPAEEPEGDEEPEEGPEGGEEGEEAEEPEDEPQTPPRDGNWIPKTRFNEINERRKAAERRAAELEARAAQTDPSKLADFDFDGKEQEYMQFVLDGDHEKAASIRREIRSAEQKYFEQMAVQQANQARESTVAQLEFDRAVAEVNAAYPVFDPDFEGYSADLVEETLELHSGLVGRGYTPAAALRKAVDYVVKANGLQADGAAPALEVAEKPAARKKGEAPKPTKKQVQNKLDMATKQPPRQAGRPAAADDVIDIDDLSDEELDALPQSKRAELRGDIL